MILRVAKDKSAFLYQLLEGYDGLTNYSTLSDDKHLTYRDIKLHFTKDLRSEVDRMIANISKDIPLEILSE